MSCVRPHGSFMHRIQMTAMQTAEVDADQLGVSRRLICTSPYTFFCIITVHKRRPSEIYLRVTVSLSIATKPKSL